MRPWPECGNVEIARAISKDSWAAMGNLFLAFHRCPQSGISAAPLVSRRGPLCKAAEQFLFGCLHLDCGADIAVDSRLSFQLVDGEMVL